MKNLELLQVMQSAETVSFGASVIRRKLKNKTNF